MATTPKYTAILFADTVGYSLLPIGEQRRVVTLLAQAFETWFPRRWLDKDGTYGCTGDGFWVAHPDSFALFSAAQKLRDHLAKGFSDCSALKTAKAGVRIGLHWGVAFSSEWANIVFPRQLFGPALNKCATIAQFGQRGEVVLSTEFRDRLVSHPRVLARLSLDASTFYDKHGLAHRIYRRGMTRPAQEERIEPRPQILPCGDRASPAPGRDTYLQPQALQRAHKALVAEYQAHCEDNQQKTLLRLEEGFGRVLVEVRRVLWTAPQLQHGERDDLLDSAIMRVKSSGRLDAVHYCVPLRNAKDWQRKKWSDYLTTQKERILAKKLIVRRLFICQREALSPDQDVTAADEDSVHQFFAVVHAHKKVGVDTAVVFDDMIRSTYPPCDLAIFGTGPKGRSSPVEVQVHVREATSGERHIRREERTGSGSPVLARASISPPVMRFYCNAFKEWWRHAISYHASGNFMRFKKRVLEKSRSILEQEG